MPKVSVIIPFYNAESTLEKAVKSIHNQTFEDLECILINNNSSDKSIEIAQSWTEKDERFKLEHETRQGVVYASNKGSYASRGKYIARMDADDIALPKRIEF